ncbi:MAG: 50S ribosomal protein L24 [Propionibacterium sp.]|nr:50S ribosomal protein L24 [Propionibacterium sp.]
MKSLHVKKGDRVKVIAGNDKGTIGEVIAVYPALNRVTVEGVNIVKRHLRDSASQPQSTQVTKGGIVASEAPIHVSNVQLVVGSGKEATVTRVGHDREEVTKRRPDGTEYTAQRSVRVLKKDAPKKGGKK